MTEQAASVAALASDDPWSGTKSVQATAPALVPLSQGGFALVDAEDLPLVAGRTWHKTAKGYARHSFRIPGAPRGKVGVLMMHEVIARVPLPLPDGVMLDHRNRVRIDNRKENLRLVLRTGNSQNITSSNQRNGGFKGVSWNKNAGKWEANIKQDGRRHYLGLFVDPVEAARVYDAEASQRFGEFAALNFPERKAH